MTGEDRKEEIHLVLAELVTKLEVVHKMYKELVRKGVGTNTVEAEMMGIVL